MIAQPQAFYISPEDYLAAELKRPIKHEYRNGSVYAMSGANDPHVRISINLVSTLNSHLRGSRCLVYSSDMKTRIEALNIYYYPDAMVTYDDRDRPEPYSKRYPKLIVEVLSPSTEAFDRGDKFDDYQHLESLEEYVLISQTRMRVETFRCNAEGLWVRYVYREGDTVELASVGWQGAIADLYENVDFTLPLAGSG
jgi:Uma2 family endonuclease